METVENTATPQETVKNYFALVEKGQYDKMYAMLSERTRETVSEKEFTERNQNIYEGIEAKDIKISLSEREKLKGSPVTVKYSETMQTSAEEISFDNEMTLHHLPFSPAPGQLPELFHSLLTLHRFCHKSFHDRHFLSESALYTNPEGWER